MCLGRTKSFFSRPNAKVEAKHPDPAAKAAGAENAPGDADKKAGGRAGILWLHVEVPH